MRGTNRRFRNCVGSGGLLLATVCLVFTPVFTQNSSGQDSAGVKTGPVPIVGNFDKIQPLPPGGPTPRMADGHPDLTGRWYPNAAGKMVQVAYPVNKAAFEQFDPAVTPEEKPSFKAGAPAKYTRPNPYGQCDQPGTPTVMLEQGSQHAPMELVQTPGRLAMMYEYPMDIRMIYLNGRQHPKDPDPTFNGDSAAHWEGDTLVIDVIAIDERLRNQPAPALGGWFPSDKDHVIESFTRTSKNYLTYQVTIEDPVVLAKPWKSAPRTWSLAQDPHDEWGEVFCTHNEEPDEIKKIDAAAKQKAK
jgi:hypothetical protein